MLGTSLVVVERRAARSFLPVELLHLPAVRYAVLTSSPSLRRCSRWSSICPCTFSSRCASNPAESGLLLLPLTAGIVGGAALAGRIIVWTGRPTAIPSAGRLLAAASLVALALLPAAKPVLITLGSRRASASAASCR